MKVPCGNVIAMLLPRDLLQQLVCSKLTCCNCFVSVTTRVFFQDSSNYLLFNNFSNNLKLVGI